VAPASPVGAVTAARARLGSVVLLSAVSVLPLAMWLGFADNVGIPKEIVLCALALSLFGLTVADPDRAGSMTDSPLFMPLALFVLSALASCLVSDSPAVAWAGEEGSWTGAARIASLALFAAAAPAWLGGGTGRKVAVLALATAAALVAYELLQAVGGDPFPWNPGLKSGYWLFATLGNPVHLANYLVCAFWLSFPVFRLAGASFAGAGRNQRLRFASFAGAGAWLFRAAVAGGAIVTFQRSVLLGFAAGGVVMLAQRRIKRIGRGSTLLSAAPFAAVPFLDAACRMLDPSTVAGARLPIWEAAWRLLRSHPWLGIGPDLLYSWFPSVATYAYYSAEPPDLTGGVVHLRLPASAHNELVGVAVTQGMIGIGIYLWALSVVIKAGIRSPLLPAALACFSIHLANPSTAATSALFWILSAMIVAGSGRDIHVCRGARPRPPILRGFRKAALGALAVLLAVSLFTALRLGVAQAHRREAGRLAFYGLAVELKGHLDRWSGYAARVHPRQAHDDAGLFASLGTSDGHAMDREAILREMAVEHNPRNIFFLGALADYSVKRGKREGDRRLLDRGVVLLRNAVASAPGTICLYDDLADALEAGGKRKEAAALRATRRRLDTGGLFGPTK